jgi:hypothetical protein
VRSRLGLLLAILGAAAAGAIVGRWSRSGPAQGAALGPIADAAKPAPRLLPVPLVRQATEYTCGAAAVTSVLAYWRKDSALREGELQKLMHTSEATGTDPVNILKTLGGIGADGGVPPPLAADGVLENDGTRTEVKEGVTILRFDAMRGPPLFDVELRYRAQPSAAAELARDLEPLRGAVARGDTVLLDVQAWREDAQAPWPTDWDDGHWVVLVGMDSDNVYLMDPYSFEGYAFVPIPEFGDRWHGQGTNKTPWHHVAIFVHARAVAPPAPSAPLLRME